MDRKTMTTLDKLREGDRFTYGLKRLDVWEVIKVEGKHIEINQRLQTGELRFKYNDKGRGSKAVLFLRHTKPLPGELCFIEDLEPGDVFFKPDDIITEYQVEKKLQAFKGFYKLRRVTDKECKAPEMTHALTTVVLVRRKEEEKK